MHPTPLPQTSLPAFAHLNAVHLNGVQITAIPGAGTGLKHDRHKYNPSKPLLTIDQDLVVCAATVEEYAKSDTHLAEVLHAVGDFARTPRGAIMVFLLMQLSTAAGLDVGQRGAWSEYIRFLPDRVSVPTTWTDAERKLLGATSLHVAVEAKLQTLSQEFANLQSTTTHIPWCNSAWWDTPTLTLPTWHHLDSLFRSRVLQFPRLGVGMAPFLDFANHSANPNAYYSVNAHGDVVLLPREENKRALEDGEELTINYGSEKSAAELVFSYGFLPSAFPSAIWLALDLKCPPDDPLARAKEAVFESAPMLRVIDLGGEIMWTGDFVWLMCVNEEDGLSFRVLQGVDGERQLIVLWDGEEVKVGKIEGLLERGERWEVFQLRATILVQERLEIQLGHLERAGEEVARMKGDEGDEGEMGVGSEEMEIARRLRELEIKLLDRALEALEEQKDVLLEVEVVKEYLGTAGMENGEGTDDEEDEDLS